MDASGHEAGHRGSLFIWHSDIGIPIHFQEESGIVKLWNIEFRMPLEGLKGSEATCPVEVDIYGFL